MNLDAYIGQPIEVEDASARDQCMDWAFLVCDLRGIPRSAIRTQYAKDVWNIFDHSILEAHQDPQPLDFAIFGAGVGSAGHIAVVKSPGATFTSWDQNWAGNQTVQVILHNRNGLLGFLRLKSSPPINQGEDDMALNASQVSAQFQTWAGRVPEQSELNYWVGKTLPELQQKLYLSPENKLKQLEQDIWKLQGK